MTNPSQIESRLFANENDYLKLISAQIVLKVLNDSIRVLEKTGDEIESPETSQEPNENYVNIRKHLNTRRWNCISRPQYKYSCGISSLVSCWNYLYSTLGYGKLKPLSQEEALIILGFEPPFDQIRFGPFTGNTTIMKWFKTLNKHFKVDGRPSFFYKPVEPNRTIGVTSRLALERLRTLLKSKNHAFIYHCYNHYFCPIGFELEPKNQQLIYSRDSSNATDQDEFVDWILVGETSRKYPAFHCFKWDDIERDLTTKSPEFLNIRKLDKGIQTRATPKTEIDQQATAGDQDKPLRVKKSGRNLHCLMMFQSFDSSFGEANSDSVEESESKNSDNEESDSE